MIKYTSSDKVLFEAIDGTVTRTLSGAYAADCKALCYEAGEALLPNSTLPSVFQKLAEHLITPGKLKRAYRKIYKAAVLERAEHEYTIEELKPV